jgi:flavodoxin/NAD-dependent dihydropyrimidine dehydrogenase PreA subunit
MQQEIPMSSSPRVLIVYGSSRGTTQQIAEAIIEGLAKQGAEASAIRFDRLALAPGRIDKADVIGVGSPTYFLRPPRYMVDFLNELPALAGKPAFVFCTAGMDRPGETLERLHAGLEARGAKLVGSRWFRSSMSYWPHVKRGLGNPAGLPDEQQLARARAWGEDLAHAEQLSEVVPVPCSRATRWKARLIGNARFRRTFFPGVELHVPPCTGYGQCLSRCSFEGLLRIDDGEIPVFDRSLCIQCLECVSSCPRGAITTDSRMKEWISTLSYRLGVH